MDKILGSGEWGGVKLGLLDSNFQSEGIFSPPNIGVSLTRPQKWVSPRPKLGEKILKVVVNPGMCLTRPRKPFPHFGC